MDADYLKKNVNEALIEALAAMAVGMPEDKVEYIGRYLLQYVQRKAVQTKQAGEASEAETKYVAYECEMDNVRAADIAKARRAAEKADRLTSYLEAMKDTCVSKQDAMNSVSSFIAEYLAVPGGVYVAVKKTAGESEALHYVAASAGQESVMVGKKLVKAVEEGDDLPPRQGLSFDAFKIPEVPEEEPPADGEEAAPPKPPPKAQPLIVENVMREKRCKFFGIPKLGSYAAIPQIYASLDHVEGCVASNAVPDPENPDAPLPPAYSSNKIPAMLLIGMDTIGDYRTFTSDEIATAVTIGERLVTVLEGIEEKMFETQTAFLDEHKGMAEAVAAIVPPLAELEAAALAAVAAELTPPPAEEGAEPVEPPPESLKTHKDTQAVLAVWKSALGDAGFAAALTSMKNHVLPVPANVTSLLFAIGCLTGTDPASLKDVCGDVSWDDIRAVFLPSLPNALTNYDAAASTSVTKEVSFAAVKASCDAGNLLDAASYPPHLVALPALSMWLGKALAAREAAINYMKEVKQVDLETLA